MICYNLNAKMADYMFEKTQMEELTTPDFVNARGNGLYVLELRRRRRGFSLVLNELKEENAEQKYKNLLHQMIYHVVNTEYHNQQKEHAVKSTSGGCNTINLQY